MSLQALNWAMVQKCGSPAAKMVLIILSRFASAEGWAWPSRQKLAEATEQSPDSVDRALRLLVERGFIAKGGRQVRTDGGNSTVKYQLLFDLRRAEADLARNHVRPRVRHNERSDIAADPAGEHPAPLPQIAAGGCAQAAAGHAANLRLGGAADCGTSHERKDSTSGIYPPSPRAGGAPAPRDFDFRTDEPAAQPELGLADEGWARRGRRAARPARSVVQPPALTAEVQARFDRLWRAFPESGRLNAPQHEAARTFAALTADEQDLAIRTATAYAATCATNRSQARRLDRWLHDGSWRNGGTPGAGPAPPIRSDKVFVREGSPEWEAWALHFRGLGRPMMTPRDIGGQEGWRFDSAWPPGWPAGAEVA